MRDLGAAAIGLAAALALTALGSSSGNTSPKPLLTTVPSHP
ncbi:SPW_0924 family protein [Streptomyces sp. NPDC002513]